MIFRKHPCKEILHFFSLALLAAVLAACNLPRGTPVFPTLTPAARNTNTTAAHTSTPTSPVPLPSNPTATNTSTSGGTGTSTNLIFTPGTTAIVETGTLGAGQMQTYTINLGASQPMILILNSKIGDDYLAVYDASNTVILDPAKKWSRFQWLMPAKVQLYTIQVIGGASTEDFNFTIKVPARIKIASGSTSATVTGATVKGYVLSYTISGATNQTLTANLSVPAGSAVMDIFGLATGDVLLSSNSNSTTFSGKLASTQDYIIEIIPQNGDVVNYSLTVGLQ